jgi:nitrate/nitrite-specific signal transduction histidine kinase
LQYNKRDLKQALSSILPLASIRVSKSPSLSSNSANAIEGINMSGSLKAQDEHVDEKTGFEQRGDEMQVAVEDEHTRMMEKRIVRKLDMTLMPAVWVLYFSTIWIGTTLRTYILKCSLSI